MNEWYGNSGPWAVQAPTHRDFWYWVVVALTVTGLLVLGTGLVGQVIRDQRVAHCWEPSVANPQWFDYHKPGCRD